jgi:hypothetical protein
VPKRGLRPVKRCLLASLLAASLATAAAADGFHLAPYKDDLFKYPAILDSQYGGDYLKIEYIERRDLDQRDAVPERRVRPQYVSLAPRKVEKDLTLDAGGLTIKYIGVGRTAGGAKAVVIYLHGMNGSRFQGDDDWMFGGNFNRIKNLMTRNGGVYLSPDFADFGDRGERQIRALMEEYARNSPGAPIFIACGSMGGYLCWRLAGDPQAARLIGGLLLLGSTHDDGFLKTAAMTDRSRRFPIFIGHGSHDTIMAWQDEDQFFRKMKAAAPDYPVKFALFDTGSHGTPIRMTDWRLVLNWMLEVDDK